LQPDFFQIRPERFDANLDNTTVVVQAANRRRRIAWNNKYALIGVERNEGFIQLPQPGIETPLKVLTYNLDNKRPVVGKRD
jgi:hypothetical protein